MNKQGHFEYHRKYYALSKWYNVSEIKIYWYNHVIQENKSDSFESNRQ